MGHWLIADLSFFDVHVQLWMLLVTGSCSFGFSMFGQHDSLS